MTITDDHRLRLDEVPEPIAAPGEVLVDIVSAGVNPADVAQVEGNYPPPAGASPYPGLEVSGYRRDTGEPVVALLAGGGYADVVAVPEVHVLPAPAGLSLGDAGGLIEVAATVVSNLVGEAGMPVGSSESERPTVLIHGATGGIGSFAIPFAAASGARVFATAGSDEGARAALELGAEAAWNRHTSDVTDEVLARGGADIILDVAGGPALDENVRALREFGRLVVISTIAGARGQLDLSALMMRRGRIIATGLRSRSLDDKARIVRLTRELVWPLLADGSVRLPIAARHPLAEAERAHEALRRGGHLGKQLLTVRPAGG